MSWEAKWIDDAHQLVRNTYDLSYASCHIPSCKEPTSEIDVSEDEVCLAVSLYYHLHLVTRVVQTISSTIFPPSPKSSQQMNAMNLTCISQLVLKTLPLEVLSNGGTTTAQHILAFCT